MKRLTAVLLSVAFAAALLTGCSGAGGFVSEGTKTDGSTLSSFAEQNGWYYVLYNGQFGWVSGEYCQ